MAKPTADKYNVPLNTSFCITDNQEAAAYLLGNLAPGLAIVCVWEHTTISTLVGYLYGQAQTLEAFPPWPSELVYDLVIMLDFDPATKKVVKLSLGAECSTPSMTCGAYYIDTSTSPGVFRCGTCPDGSFQCNGIPTGRSPTCNPLPQPCTQAPRACTQAIGEAVLRPKGAASPLPGPPGTAESEVSPSRIWLIVSIVAAIAVVAMLVGVLLYRYLPRRSS